jgi:hypothetical protein
MMPRPQARLLAVANSAIDSSFRQIQSDRIGGAQNDNPAPRPGELDDAKAILAEWFKFNPKINPLTLAALPSHPRTTWSKRWPLGGTRARQPIVLRSALRLAAVARNGRG